MKTNILTAAMILTGCLCAYGYLSAQSNGIQTTSSIPSALLEVREPSREDFEHCMKRAVCFFESWSEDQAEMDIAMRELTGVGESTPQLMGMSRQLSQIKSMIPYGHLELVAKKSLGENIIALYYIYHTDKGRICCRFLFARTLDRSGEPGQWQAGFQYTDDPDMFLNQL